jgi:hypothetical protein
MQSSEGGLKRNSQRKRFLPRNSQKKKKTEKKKMKF